jgi:paraquat-inducible protein A
LWQHEQFLIAMIVFVASFTVPLFKLGALVMLLLAAQNVFPANPLKWTRLYRFLEFIGRWSMLDIFVVTLMVAVVQLGNVSRVIAGGGSFAFTLVVIVTMLASSCFDPRLLWDKETQQESNRV